MRPMQFRIWEHMLPRDLEFLLQCLAKSKAERSALLRLLADPSEAVVLMDSERLYRTVLEATENLPISPRFYFYILLRQSFKASGIGDPSIADYVASVLGEYGRSCRSVENAALLYSVDFLEEIKKASAYERFFVYSGAANRYLFLTGLFPDYLQKRESRHGLPSIDYYEGLAAQSYRSAARHPLAREFDLAEVFLVLSQEFRRTRKLLNGMADVLISLN